MIIQELTNAMSAMGFERFKLHFDNKTRTLTIKVPRPIPAVTIEKIDSFRPPGVFFFFGTLSWWECRLESKVFRYDS